MRRDQARLAARFRDNYGVISRSELRALGVSARVEQARVLSGEWERVTSRVIRVGGSPPMPEQDLMVALLHAGPVSVASHSSATWLWGLTPAPATHHVTMPLTATYRSGPYQLHRLRGPEPEVSFRRRIPTTNPLRALVDVAAVVTAGELDDAVDRAVASKLVTVQAIKAELGRISRRGRSGAGAMAASLRRRGLVEGPNPSALEARLHRLFKQGGIVPMSVETIAGAEGQYRLDCVLVPGVAVEVDGHVYHSTPEQKAADERRRAEIRLGGMFLLVYDWMAVFKDGRRVLAECHQAIAAYGPAAGRLTGT